MTLLAVPNVSEGRSRARITSFEEALRTEGVRMLDVSSDVVHNRSVFTIAGTPDGLPAALASLAEACSYIDLTTHHGAHPRLGGLDVCPIVPHETDMDHAVEVAHGTGRSIHDRTSLPIYFYGAAAARPQTRELPDLRRGGLSRLVHRAQEDLPPDLGTTVDIRKGVVCVGARGVLIAFNVFLRASGGVARAIASRVRAAQGGLPGMRALGFPIDEDTAQVSMNLTRPEMAGIDDAFEAVRSAARSMEAEVVGTEIVGLVPERFLPKGRAARLLREPSRSLDAALRD